eukprot:g2807.t1
MPDALRGAYTMDGRVPVGRFFVDDTNGGKGTHYRYPRADLDHMITAAERELATAKRRLGDGDSPQQPVPRAILARPRSWVAVAIARHAATLFRGQRVLVFGSMEPWYESLALAAGAANVTVVEYNRLTYAHDRIRTLTVAQAVRGLRPGSFDTALSISSFDHDGLGRYGDPLAPDGDVAAMRRARELLRPGGALLLTVPVGPDVVVWNLHRRYGRARLPMLLEGWDERVEERVGWIAAKLDAEANWRRSYEPVFVLRRPRTENGKEKAGGPLVLYAAGAWVLLRLLKARGRGGRGDRAGREQKARKQS